MKKAMAVLFVLLSVHALPHKAFAQTDPDEAYDPFSDYSEFDEASDEEADINFFKNGRFFTVAMVLGPRGYTENLAKVYNDGPSYGLQLSYFFDLRLALALGILMGDSSVNFNTNANSYSGNVGKVLQSLLPAVLEADPWAEDLCNAAALCNVRRVVKELREEASPALLEPQAAGRLMVVGAYYHLDSGRVDFFQNY